MIQPGGNKSRPPDLTEVEEMGENDEKGNRFSWGSGDNPARRFVALLMREVTRSRKG